MKLTTGIAWHHARKRDTRSIDNEDDKEGVSETLNHSESSGSTASWAESQKPNASDTSSMGAWSPDKSLVPLGL